MAVLVPMLLSGVLLGSSSSQVLTEERGTQYTTVVPLGARMRVTLAASLLTGTVLGIDDNALTLKVKNSNVPAIIPRSDINRLEISRGVHSAAGWGAGIGFLALAALSLPAWQGCGSCSGSAPARFVMFYGALGAGLGAGIGYAIRAERWEGVPASRVQVGLAPLPGRGWAARVSVAWGSRPALP
jgi:hypothetical protein